jgi:hypothetical protein
MVAGVGSSASGLEARSPQAVDATSTINVTMAR